MNDVKAQKAKMVIQGHRLLNIQYFIRRRKMNGCKDEKKFACAWGEKALGERLWSAGCICKSFLLKSFVSV